MMVQLYKAYVRLPSEEYIAHEVVLDPKLWPFHGCIGAIDGTHLYAHIPEKRQKRWRNRKGWISQNVFAAVRMDGKFSYVLAGAEGSMYDSHLLNNALSQNFNIASNRFYLADAGFG